MWLATVYCIALLVSWTVCIPVHPATEKLPENIQNHQVDNIEVHHDIEAIKNQELANDLLPDQSNDAAGDRQLNNDEQRQENSPDVVLPVAPDGNAALAFDSDNDEKKINFESVGKMKKLPVEKLIPHDHLDVVKMEQDGHLNKDYHKEMFLGEQHDEFREETIENAENKLREIVAKADTDKDGNLSALEMEKWILKKMIEHFKMAKMENAVIFKHLDSHGNGLIKWKDYYLHFLLSRGFSIENALQHVVDYDESIKLDQDDKDALVSYKYRWTDADTNPTDNQLSEEEFMVFRHPEHSKESLESMANNVMRGLDSNSDGYITEIEFAALPPGEVEGKEFQEMDKKWQEDRRKEFRQRLDANRDGRADMEELKNYLDPTNPMQARNEADTLMFLMDDDKNDLLSLPEILKHSDIFISSKIVNYGANVHDEF